MAKNVLFLIHGVGNHETGWSKDTQKLLADEFARYMKHTGKSAKLKDELQFVEITYNDIFQAVWKRWSDLAKSLDPVPNIPNPVAKINRFLGAATPTGSQVGNNNAVDFAGDVLLYVGFRLVRRLVQLKVMSTIASNVAKFRKLDIRTDFGVLSHSMGTAVAHDALHLLATTDWSGGKWNTNATGVLADAENAFKKKTGRTTGSQRETLAAIKKNIGPAAFSPGRLQFAGLFTFANVSRVVSRTVNPYNSVVRPDTSGLASSVQGNTDAFYNIAHELDPIAQVKKFETTKFGNTGGNAIDIQVTHIYEKNVHSLNHYLLNPKAHRFVLKKMCKSFGGRESEYVDRRFSEELKAEAHPDFFSRRGGNFSSEKVAKDMRDRIAKKLTKTLEGLV